MTTVAPDAVAPATKPLSGIARVPGDKSISHRVALLAAVAEGTSTVEGFSDAGDCAATLRVVRSLGVAVEEVGGRLTVEGRGWAGLLAPGDPLDCGRSGTTMRLACGLLAGVPVEATLTGDAQLLRRPMERVAEPLRRMGARVTTVEGHAPVHVAGGELSGIRYELPVASAQVKSAVLLAGLRASGATTVVEPVTSRDHTERLLGWLGVPLDSGAGTIEVRSSEVPPLRDVRVPGDVSAAAPLLAAAAAVPGSHVTIEEVGLNPTRTAFVDLLGRMGADVQTEPSERGGPEPFGRMSLRHAELSAIEVGAEDVPALIDELPLVGVLGALADGTTVVRGAEELRVKESDRIAVLVRGLRGLGAEVEELPDGFAVTGPTRMRSSSVDADGDHRLAMAFAVAGLAADGPVAIEGLDRVADSFPSFLDTLGSLR